jgi:transposase
VSLHPEPIEPVPEETARAARAAFPRGKPYLRLRDTLGSIYADADVADLFPRRGQSAEAVRGRIDPGFDFSVLSEFRVRLITGAAEQRLLDRLLAVS